MSDDKLNVRAIVLEYLKTENPILKKQLTTCELAYCARQKSISCGTETKKKRIKLGKCCE